MEKDDPRYPGLDARYSDLSEAELPLAENLNATIDRVIPYWKEIITPLLLMDKKIIIAAHGNSLRALVKYLDKLSDEEIMVLNIK